MQRRLHHRSPAPPEQPVTYQHSPSRLAGCISGILGVGVRGRRGTGDLQSSCFLRGYSERPSSESPRHRKRYTGRDTERVSSSRTLPREHLQPHHTQLRERLSYQGPCGARPTVRSSWNKHCAAIVEIQINPNCEFRKSPVLEAVEMTLTQCASGFSVE